MRAIWIVNGVLWNPQELSAEKPLLLEEWLTFQLLHSLTNLLQTSDSVCH